MGEPIERVVEANNLGLLMDGKLRFENHILKVCFVTTAVCCSTISSCGCILGFPGVLLPQLQQPGSTFRVSDEQASWIASVRTLPMFVGNSVVPVVMARLGRRAALLVVSVLTLLSWATVILASSYEAMIVGRILQGASSGMMMPLRSVLISESTSPYYRGAFLTTTSLAQIIGVLLVHLIGSFISYRMTALVSMSFSGVSFLMTIFTPETPSWLAMKGQFEKCRESFMWLRSREEIPELEKMINASKLNESRKKQNKLKEICLFAKRKEFYKPILLMLSVLNTVNFTIATLLVVYPIPILTALMGPEVNASIWMVVFDVQGLLFCFAAVFVIHKIKRRTLLFSAGVICAGGQIALAAYEFAKTRGIISVSMWIPCALISLQIACENIGLMPLGTVLAGEVFPLKSRSYSESLSLLLMLLTVFVLLKTFPDLKSLVGLHGMLTLYAGMMVVCLVVAWFLLPETSGRTLQQIEDHFRGAPLPDPEDHEETETLNEVQEIKSSLELTRLSAHLK